jgi:hypothetical protein
MEAQDVDERGRLVTTGEIRNSKLETRNKFEIRNSKLKKANLES